MSTGSKSHKIFGIPFRGVNDEIAGQRRIPDQQFLNKMLHNSTLSLVSPELAYQEVCLIGNASEKDTLGLGLSAQIESDKRQRVGDKTFLQAAVNLSNAQNFNFVKGINSQQPNPERTAARVGPPKILEFTP